MASRTTAFDLSDKGTIGSRTVSATKIDGTISPIHYQWYETDITWSQAASTWMDAENTFDRFARRVVSGDAVAER